MKKIQSACLEQTIHFTLKDDLSPTEAAALVKQEREHYQIQLDRRHIRYKIEGEETLPDGSILLKIRRQYNAYPCGDYLA